MELPKVKKKKTIILRENGDRDMNRQFTGKKSKWILTLRQLTQDERNTKCAEKTFHA